ncbi:MAG: hypothetical protein NC231_13675 [Bacillus sp. (in: Bacteria)]|nr:hypothetical protein [Bacillus sp. (in: firmicutes)]MCM1426969.1 hypothetical protein [Eubacterium sp.]
MGLTFLLTVGMMVLLFLMIWSATLTLPYKGLAKNFPKDVQEQLAPRLDNLPISGKRILGWVILIFLLMAMLGMMIYAGVDGIRQGYGFGRFLLRFLIMGIGIKIFDIVGLDFFLLTKSHFFQHYFPETEGCAGWKDFGFNRKEQIRQCIMIPVCCLVLAGIFTYIG